MRDTMEGEEVVRQDMPGRERCTCRTPTTPAATASLGTLSPIRLNTARATSTGCAVQ